MPNTNTLAAKIAIITILAYQLIAAALIFLRPEIDPARQPISEYAIGRLGWLMMTAFLCSAASYGALCLILKDQLHGFWGKAGLTLLIICTIGTVGVGIFVSDPIAVPMDQLSPRGNLHVLFGTSALMLLPFAALIINLNLARNPAWASAKRTLLWTAGLPLFGWIAFIIMVATLTPAEGWPPRFMFLTYTVWVIVLAAQTQRLHQPTAATLATPAHS
jgi:hypothetical protein